MQVLSKPLNLENIIIDNEPIMKDERVNNIILCWYDYFKNNTDLKKYKLKELKEIAKINKIKISGTKKVLSERIIEHFFYLKKIVKVQSYVRRYLVKLSFLLRGPALKNRSICVNDCDFYTLEPLKNIEHNDFVSFQDENNFIYGFDLNSILKLLNKENDTILNPYNRNPLNHGLIKNILCLNNLTNIIYKKNVFSINVFRKNEKRKILNLKKEKLNKLKEKRMNATILSRIQELFMEIDILGNYTQSSWFLDLNKNELLNLMYAMKDIWMCLNNEIKKRVCPYYNPLKYAMVFNIDAISENRINLYDIIVMCLTIAENMVYTGIDNNFRQLGALYFLKSLTIVSLSARNSLPWLYETIIN